MTTNYPIKLLLKDISSRADIELLQSSSDLHRFSRDFYDYSPVLKEKLSHCIAELVVRPSSVEAVLVVASACFRHSIPLTLRGSGTGNYGQCVPLKGGVVMLMNGLRQIRDFNPVTGEVTVETGCLLRDLNEELIRHGRQLRLLPSTWRSASVGGFIAGGSGGIGSVRWGFLRDPGHLTGLEIITLEKSPKILNLNGSSAEPLNHAYGTNGIISSLTLTTTPFICWHEAIVDCSNWSQAVDLMKQFTCAAIDLYLCTLLERKVVEQLPHWCGSPTDNHRILLLLAPDGIETVRRLSVAIGANFKDLGPENLQRGTGIRELSWNHTTLHMRGSDKNWTYLQMLLPQPELKMMQEIKETWGDNVLWHLEGVRQFGVQRLAALPLVRWQGMPSLNKLMNQCKEKGAIIFNPHAITVEDGGLGVVDADQVNAKSSYDPKSLLNPGKLKGCLINS